MKKQFKTMEEYCEYIRKLFNLSIPVNALNLIKRCGVSIKPGKIEQIAIYKNFNLLYDKDLDIKVINFAAAKELAKLFWTEKYTDKICNEFAAELLMPKSEFISICINNPDESDEVSLSKLSDYFQVSQHAINTRGQVLGLWK